MLTYTNKSLDALRDVAARVPARPHPRRDRQPVPQPPPLPRQDQRAGPGRRDGTPPGRDPPPAARELARITTENRAPALPPPRRFDPLMTRRLGLSLRQTRRIPDRAIRQFRGLSATRADRRLRQGLPSLRIFAQTRLKSVKKVRYYPLDDRCELLLESRRAHEKPRGCRRVVCGSRSDAGTSASLSRRTSGGLSGIMDAGSLIRGAWELVPILLLLLVGGAIAVRSGVHHLTSRQNLRQVMGNRVADPPARCWPTPRPCCCLTNGSGCGPSVGDEPSTRDRRRSSAAAPREEIAMAATASGPSVGPRRSNRSGTMLSASPGSCRAMSRMIRTRGSNRQGRLRCRALAGVTGARPAPSIHRDVDPSRHADVKNRLYDLHPTAPKFTLLQPQPRSYSLRQASCVQSVGSKRAKSHDYRGCGSLRPGSCAGFVGSKGGVKVRESLA